MGVLTTDIEGWWCWGDSARIAITPVPFSWAKKRATTAGAVQEVETPGCPAWLLQYHVITDSKILACLLLSLESLYPPSRQMALDMMARLGTATHEITEILLDNGHIVTALNFGTEIFGPAPSCHLLVIRCFSSGQQWGRLRPCQEVS